MPRPVTANDISLREYLDSRIECAVDTLRAELATARAAMQCHVESAAQRIDVLNEHRSTLADTVLGGMLRQEIEAKIRELESNFQGAIAPIRQRTETLSRTNWPLLAAFASIFVSVTFGVWVIIGLKIDATNQPLNVAAETARVRDDQLDTRLRSAEGALQTINGENRSSMSDRSQLNARLETMEHATGALNVQGATMVTKLTEIETQFCAADIVRNLMHAQDMRIQSMLWKKAFPEAAIPTDNAYYPTICQRKIHDQ